MQSSRCVGRFIAATIVTHVGETPCAFVTLKPESEASAEDIIIAFCRSHLARFKAPRTVLFGPLPKTSTGKIQKFVLRERARSG